VDAIKKICIIYFSRLVVPWNLFPGLGSQATRHCFVQMSVMLAAPKLILMIVATEVNQSKLAGQ